MFIHKQMVDTFWLQQGEMVSYDTEHDNRKESTRRSTAPSNPAVAVDLRMMEMTTRSSIANCWLRMRSCIRSTQCHPTRFTSESTWRPTSSGGGGGDDALGEVENRTVVQLVDVASP